MDEADSAISSMQSGNLLSAIDHIFSQGNLIENPRVIRSIANQLSRQKHPHYSIKKLRRDGRIIGCPEIVEAILQLFDIEFPEREFREIATALRYAVPGIENKLLIEKAVKTISESSKPWNLAAYLKDIDVLTNSEEVQQSIISKAKEIVDGILWPTRECNNLPTDGSGGCSPAVDMISVFPQILDDEGIHSGLQHAISVCNDPICVIHAVGNRPELLDGHDYKDAILSRAEDIAEQIAERYRRFRGWNLIRLIRDVHYLVTEDPVKSSIIKALKESTQSVMKRLGYDHPLLQTAEVEEIMLEKIRGEYPAAYIKDAAKIPGLIDKPSIRKAVEESIRAYAEPEEIIANLPKEYAIEASEVIAQKQQTKLIEQIAHSKKPQTALSVVARSSLMDNDKIRDAIRARLDNEAERLGRGSAFHRPWWANPITDITQIAIDVSACRFLTAMAKAIVAGKMEYYFKDLSEEVTSSDEFLRYLVLAIMDEGPDITQSFSKVSKYADGERMQEILYQVIQENREPWNFASRLLTEESPTIREAMLSRLPDIADGLSEHPDVVITAIADSEEILKSEDVQDGLRRGIIASSNPDVTAKLVKSIEPSSLDLAAIDSIASSITDSDAPWDLIKEVNKKKEIASQSRISEAIVEKSEKLASEFEASGNLKRLREALIYLPPIPQIAETIAGLIGSSREPHEVIGMIEENQSLLGSDAVIDAVSRRVESSMSLWRLLEKITEHPPLSESKKIQESLIKLIEEDEDEGMLYAATLVNSAKGSLFDAISQYAIEKKEDILGDGTNVWWYSEEISAWGKIPEISSDPRYIPAVANTIREEPSFSEGPLLSVYKDQALMKNSELRKELHDIITSMKWSMYELFPIHGAVGTDGIFVSTEWEDLRSISRAPNSTRAEIKKILNEKGWPLLQAALIGEMQFISKSWIEGGMTLHERIKSVFEVFEMEELFGINKLADLFAIMPKTPDFDEIRKLVYDKALELAEEQVKDKQAVLFFDVERMAKTPAVKIIKDIVQRRADEMDEIAGVSWGKDLISLKKLMDTDTGFRILSSLNMWMFTDTKGFENVQKSLQKMGHEISLEIVDQKHSEDSTPTLSQRIAESYLTTGADREKLERGINLLVKEAHPDTVDILTSLIGSPYEIRYDSESGEWESPSVGVSGLILPVLRALAKTGTDEAKRFIKNVSSTLKQNSHTSEEYRYYQQDLASEVSSIQASFATRTDARWLVRDLPRLRDMLSDDGKDITYPVEKRVSEIIGFKPEGLFEYLIGLYDGLFMVKYGEHLQGFIIESIPTLVEHPRQLLIVCDKLFDGPHWFDKNEPKYWLDEGMLKAVEMKRMDALVVLEGFLDIEHRKSISIEAIVKLAESFIPDVSDAREPLLTLYHLRQVLEISDNTNLTKACSKALTSAADADLKGKLSKGWDKDAKSLVKMLNRLETDSAMISLIAKEMGSAEDILRAATCIRNSQILESDAVKEVINDGMQRILDHITELHAPVWTAFAIRGLPMIRENDCVKAILEKQRSVLLDTLKECREAWVVLDALRIVPEIALSGMVAWNLDHLVKDIGDFVEFLNLWKSLPGALEDKDIRTALKRRASWIAQLISGKEHAELAVDIIRVVSSLQGEESIRTALVDAGYDIGKISKSGRKEK